VRDRPGFTLVEALIGLALSLFVVVSGVELFGLAQRAFFRLKEREEAGQAAAAALDRMRIDLLHAGRGLAGATAAGLVEAVRADGGALRTAAAERTLVLAADAAAGEARLRLASTADIAAGRRVLIEDGAAGEVRVVAAVEPGAVRLDAPLSRGCAAATASVSLVEEVAYFVDGAARVLKRRANAAPAQPALEGVRAAVWTYDAGARLARVRLEVDVEGAHPYEATVLVKNAALAQGR
jgi:type II secretory pathway pseudopilin PulG